MIAVPAGSPKGAPPHQSERDRVRAIAAGAVGRLPLTPGAIPEALASEKCYRALIVRCATLNSPSRAGLLVLCCSHDQVVLVDLEVVGTQLMKEMG